MRLWSLHPSHLDRQGLTACWREALLAQAVLAGRTRGYTRHPQLDRLRASGDPMGAVTAYLDGIRAEAAARGFHYDPARVDDDTRLRTPIEVTDGQLALEWRHLLAKLEVRDPDRWRAQRDLTPTPHPLFVVVPGPVADWERARSEDDR